jgi:Wiskott-Aldrich syndrome protein
MATDELSMFVGGGVELQARAAALKSRHPPRPPALCFPRSDGWHTLAPPGPPPPPPPPPPRADGTPSPPAPPAPPAPPRPLPHPHPPRPPSPSHL